MKQSVQSAALRQRGAANRQTLIGAAVAAGVVLLALWLFWPRGDLPDDTGPTPTPAPLTTEEERGDSAREVIAALREAPQPDYAAAYARGREFQTDGRLADAQLLYFFAARGGNADAAFALGGMNDPLRFSAETSLMSEPDAFQAYKYYVQARDGGVAAAGDRLAALRDWTEQRAAAGDTDAEQLLVQWE